MINDIKEKISEKKYIIIGVLLLIGGFIAWNVFSTDLPNNGSTDERLDNELKSIENKQSAITDTSERIEKRLGESSTTVNRITGKLEESRKTNTRIIERYNSFEELIDSNTKSIKECERIIEEVKTRSERTDK